MRQGLSFQEAEGEASYYPLAAGASLVCLALFTVLGPYGSRQVWNNYSLLPEGVRVDWNTRIISFVHATTVSLMAAYAHFFDDDMHVHPTWWDCSIVRAACSIVVGYMLWDLFIITFYYKYMGDIEYYFHHSVAVCAYYYVVTYSVLPYFANFRLLSEVSTPFLNIRWFLLTLGLTKSSKWFLLNEVTLLVSFFFCRVLAIPLYWHKVGQVYQTDGFSSLGYTPLVMVLTCLVLDFLNVYWFCKLVSGFVKILSTAMLSSGRGSSKRSEKREVKAVKSG